ncbi:hypothetical protein [Actinokineospora sp. NBRC 105648]|uniref:hypothetical protein n=1 Tax=Actinokineospora sp. NBRC 105648 TaxID=3032206 RepID=UPI0024A5F236|nr:hypothetical protein [Actinokineospora sp. NBRC 105648]GLZ37777.1 hypothetical protein Acsp05_14020 [Actinokineospora sp. NBRC 105648]
MTTIIEEQVFEVEKAAHALLPARDFTRPGPHPMSLAEANSKIQEEYSEALDLLGRL